MTHAEKVEAVLAHNQRLVRRNGPRLLYGMKHIVLAVDKSKGMMLLGGLGAMGVGKMWFTIDKDAYGFQSAPEGHFDKDTDLYPGKYAFKDLL